MRDSWRIAFYRWPNGKGQEAGRTCALVKTLYALAGWTGAAGFGYCELNRIDEIALRVADKYDPRENYFPYRNDLLLYVKELLAELSKDVEPIYQFRPDCENWIDCTKKFYDEWGGEKRVVLGDQSPDGVITGVQLAALWGLITEENKDE